MMRVSFMSHEMISYQKELIILKLHYKIEKRRLKRLIKEERKKMKSISEKSIDISI